MKGEQSKKYFFRSVEVENGLSQNSVYAILQDEKGFMWFGTQDGLNRYDGTSFKVFKRDIGNSSSSIVSNVVTSIMQDHNNIIWLGTTDGVSLYNPLYESFSRLEVKTEKGEAIAGVIRDIKTDKSGNIWIASSEKGLYRLSPQQKLDLFSLKDNNGRPIGVWDIEFDKDGNIWLATLFGIYCFNPETKSYQHYWLDKNRFHTADNTVTELLLLDTDILLVGSANKGLQAFNLNSKKFAPFLEKDDENNPIYVRSILKSKNGDLWIGSESGVYIYNIQTKTNINLRHVSNDPHSLSDNAIHSLFQDKEGGMWIGTFFGGVNYYSDSYSSFQKFYPVKGSNSISGKSISEFCEDSQNNIWIGTEDAGLNRFNPSTLQFSSGFIPPKNVHALMVDRDKLWIGTFSEGLYVMDIKSNEYKVYKSSPDKHSLNNNSIYSIYKDLNDTIWVGTMSGLHTYNPVEDCFNRIEEDRITYQVNDILEDYKGKLWFATLGNGLFTYDKNDKSWKHYKSVLENDNVAGRMITCILYDSKNRLWIGTEGAGLCMYNTEEDSFNNLYTTKNGLPNDVIYQLVEDREGNLWGSTNKGLFTINQDKVTVYDHANGLLGDQFNYKSGFLSQRGELYFGGIKGFVSFLPYRLVTNETIPPVTITDFFVYRNKSKQDKNPNSAYSITHTETIDIPHEASTFSLSVAALSYVSPEGNNYAFKLEGRDQEWIYTGNTHQVTYSELPPGSYIFKAKASNSDGLWNEDGISLVINVLPPFYRTIWAYILYAFIICLLLYYSIKRYLKRVKKHNERAWEELEREKEKELYNAKISFFTNITHEIRTPLSLIKSPLEDIISQTDSKDRNWESLKMIERNTKRLLLLVNELLDFRNIESKGMSLDFLSIDLIPLIEDIISRFSPTANLKGIALTTDIPYKSFFIDAHPETITKVLSNVLNNALKHAITSINISLNTDDNFVHLKISNDGDPIPKEYAKKIFEPFFKLNEKIQGSGIGLPLVRSLIKLHNGECFLSEEDTQNTTFIIKIPIFQKNTINLNKATPNDDIIESTKEDGSTPDIGQAIQKAKQKKVLIVEDNEDFILFTAKQLKNDYDVLQASNGQAALDILKKEHIDIVISDIMMPVMDGMELCRIIKENIEYSHIPVILLTAKTSLQSKIDGIKIGADEYIVKPYSIDYLKARIENLLDSRTKLKESYRESPELAYETIAHSKADELFLKKLIDIIHEHIEEVDLDVDKLAESMHMSRATLYRKVKSISELTPNDFIRIIRLKRAAELLKQREYKVNEIAFIVGFKSSSYFSKCFYKQFGVLPKDFIDK